MRYCYCEAEVRSSSVSVVYVVRLRIVFSKAALQKRGSIEPMKPPLDPPLWRGKVWSILSQELCQCLLIDRGYMLASFPGPAQPSVTYSVEKWERAWSLFLQECCQDRKDDRKDGRKGLIEGLRTTVG